MSNFTYLSRESFNRGVDEVMTLKSLRRAARILVRKASGQIIDDSIVKSTENTPRKNIAIIVERHDDKGWHVKKAS